MHILLHIGQSKTGTSAIQAYLTLNRISLRKAGILYPSVTIGGMEVDIGSHNSVADALAGLSRFPYLTADQYFDQFFDEARKSRAKLVILSGEHFFGGEPRVWNVSDTVTYFNLYLSKINALAKYLEGHEVSLLVYLRPQNDWLASAISQTVRIEQLISPGKPIYQSDRQFFEMAKPLLSYYRLIDIWVKCLCPQKVTVVPYERKLLHKKSTIADFLYRTGLDHLDLPFGSARLQVNQSLSREYIEVKKILNRTPRKEIEESVIITCLERLSARKGDITPYRLDDELSREVESFVASDNLLLNKLFTKEGTPLKAQSASLETSDTKAVSKGIIAAHFAEFEEEFASPRARLLTLDYTVRAFLRKHVKPVHSALHQLKRMYRAQVYRK